jgi:arginyl-tRNA synthetase
MNNIFQIIKESIKGVLVNFEIEEDVIIIISKLEEVDIQINNLVKYKNHPSIEEIKNEILSSLNKFNYFKKIDFNEIGFLNIVFNLESLSKEINNDRTEFNSETPENILIDYGGPNIGKPLHVGHMRTLNIGRSLYNMYKFSGNNVVSDLHLGDWGMPVAQIITYINNHNVDIETLSSDDLQNIYPKASREYSDNASFKSAAQEINKLLNLNDVEVLNIWKSIKETSNKSLEKNFDLLGHQFDYWYGESDVNNLIEPMINDLKKDNKIIEDSGAFISAEDTDPKILITKSDGSYLYITTDLATVLYRQENLPYSKALYVVDNRQSLHFDQLFKCIKFFGFNNLEHEHIAYGTLNDINGNPFKTRDGETKPLSELFEETFEHLKSINPSLENEILHQLTNSVLTYSDLLTNRKTDYKFDMEKFTNITGKTGLYVQYAQVRAQRLLANFNENKFELSGDLDTKEERLLIHLFLFSYYLNQSISMNEPHHLANYLYDISNLFNNFYEDEKILNISDKSKLNNKLFTLNLFIKTSHHAMFCLGMNPVEKM